MPPVIKKKSWKEVNAERKSQQKKWKEQKLLKKAGFKKGIEEAEKDEKEDVAESAESEWVINHIKTETESSSKNIGPKLTVSIAVPGSILGNAQSPELKAYLAGQIARAACIYNVDEVGISLITIY